MSYFGISYKNKKRILHFLTIIIFNFIVFIVLFFALEVLLRIFLGAPPKDPVEVVIPDMVINHKWRPNVNRVDDSYPLPYRLVTNSQSWLEEYDVNEEKAEKVFRIFYVGDSNVQGVVDPEDKMVEVVENNLNIFLEEYDFQAEVINTGTTSYSTLLYYILVRDSLLKYDPDLVVINVDMTDVRDDVHYQNLAEFDQDKLPISVKPAPKELKTMFRLAPEGLVEVNPIQRIVSRIRAFLIKRSALYFHLGNKIHTLIREIKNNSEKNTFSNDPNVVIELGNWTNSIWSEEVFRDVEFSMHVLGKTIDLVKENGIKMAVTGVPRYRQYNGDESNKPHEEIRNVAQEHGALYIDSYESMKKEIEDSLQEDFYWKTDSTHFNPKGNHLWAEVQSSFLLDPKNKLFPIDETSL